MSPKKSASASKLQAQRLQWPRSSSMEAMPQPCWKLGVGPASLTIIDVPLKRRFNSLRWGQEGHAPGPTLTIPEPCNGPRARSFPVGFAIHLTAFRDAQSNILHTRPRTWPQVSGESNPSMGYLASTPASTSRPQRIAGSHTHSSGQTRRLLDLPPLRMGSCRDPRPLRFQFGFSPANFRLGPPIDKSEFSQQQYKHERLGLGALLQQPLHFMPFSGVVVTPCFAGP